MPGLCGEPWAVKVKDVDQPRLYTKWDDIEKDFLSGDLHPSDVKPAVIKTLNEFLQPVRHHFTNDPYARNLLNNIKRWQAEMAAKKGKK